MTFKEWMETNHPEKIGSSFAAGVRGCPYMYNLETKEQSASNCFSYSGEGCEYCWNREMITTLKDLLKKRNYLIPQNKFNVGDKVTVNPNWKEKFPYKDHHGIRTWREYLEKTYTIETIAEKTCTLEENPFIWPYYMLKGVEEK